MNKVEVGHHSPDQPNIHGNHGDRVFKDFPPKLIIVGGTK
jgi:hypothetical protein